MFLPESDWIPPDEFPDLSQAPLISIDLETCDPGLIEYGPGWPWGEGHVAGVAVAWDHGSWYFPIGHKQGDQLDKTAVVEWLRQVLSNPKQPKVMFNAVYDLGWLKWLGVPVAGKIHDPMLGAALLDESRRSYSLDSLAKDWVRDEKDERLLREAGEHFGLKNVKAEMWKLPSKYVGPYAEHDARLNIKMHRHIQPLLEVDGLSRVYDLECAQLPVLLEMRSRGVRVDEEAADKMGRKLQKTEDDSLKKLKELTGRNVDVWSNKNLGEVYKEAGINHLWTEKGNPSFPSEWLDKQTDPISKEIKKIRKANRMRTTFSSGMVLEHSHNGRIHAQFNQLRTEYGTVSGRYSSSKPNLQQVPRRDKVLGPMIRGLFLPEKGTRWLKADYSQQEPRIAVHYAVLLQIKGAAMAQEFYIKNPNADYHQMTADLAGIDREPAKTINLGTFYGMGIQKLADSLGISYDEAKVFREKYFEKVPFIRPLSNTCRYKAEERGFIRTIMGRRCRFNEWQSADFDLSRELPAMDDRKAMLAVVTAHIDALKEKGEPLPKYGVKRAFCYKALNRLIQGSAADQTKQALVDCHNAGYTPHIQVHDELDFSVENEKQAREIKEIMESAVELRVPVVCDLEIGANWSKLNKL